MSWDIRRAIVLGVCVALLIGIIPAPVALGGPGGPAPSFALELFTGKTLTLADLKGSAVVLLFWTQW